MADNQTVTPDQNQAAVPAPVSQGGLSQAPGSASPNVKVDMSKFVPLASLAAASKSPNQPKTAVTSSDIPAGSINVLDPNARNANPEVDMSKFKPLITPDQEISKIEQANPISDYLKSKAEQNRQENLKAAAEGKPLPHSENINTLLDAAGTVSSPHEMLQTIVNNPISNKVSKVLSTPSEWAAQRRQDNLKAIAEGKPAPHSEAVNTVLDSIGSAGKMAGGLTQPINLVAPGAFEVAPVTTTLLFSGQGAKMLLSPQQPGETEDQVEERRLMGAAMLFGSSAGLDNAIKTGAAQPELNAVKAGAEALGTVGKTVGKATTTALNNFPYIPGTGKRIFEYTPREVEGTEITGRRSVANLAQGPINRSMGAAPRDVRYGDPAKALIDNNIMAPTNIGRLQRVNQTLDDIGPKVDAALAANPKTVPVDDIIENQITKAQQEIQRSKMTPAEKRTANRQLEALREEEPKGEYNLKDANDIKQRVGDAVNWEKRPSPMATPVESAYRTVYGDIKTAINKAAPDVAAMNENRTNLMAAKNALQEGALLRSKIGQGPLAHSMGIFNPQLYEAMAGHIVSPVLAAFGHTPEVPEIPTGEIDVTKPLPENPPENPTSGAAPTGTAPIEPNLEIRSASGREFPVPPERTTGSPELDTMIKQGGGIPAGVMKAAGGMKSDLILFHDPQTGSTLAMPRDEMESADSIADHLSESRAKFKPQSNKLLEIPSHLLPEGTSTTSAIQHEIGHLIAADSVGLPPVEIRSHLHPKVSPTAAASAIVDFSKLGADENGLIRKPLQLNDFIHKLLPTYLGGGIIQEAIDGLPIAQNKGMFGDLNQIQRIGDSLGISKAEQARLIQATIGKYKKMLTKPEVLDTIKKYSETREPGLDTNLHMSKDRVQQMLSDIKNFTGEK